MVGLFYCWIMFLEMKLCYGECGGITGLFFRRRFTHEYAPLTVAVQTVRGPPVGHTEVVF